MILNSTSKFVNFVIRYLLPVPLAPLEYSNELMRMAREDAINSRILNLTLPPSRLRGIEMVISCTFDDLLVETFVIY